MREITRFNKICETYDLPKIYCSLSITDTLASTGANQDLGFGLLLRHCGDHSLLVGRPLDRHHVILMLFFAEYILETRHFEGLAASPFNGIAHGGTNYDSISDELIERLLIDPTLSLEWNPQDCPPNYLFEFFSITAEQYFHVWD